MDKVPYLTAGWVFLAGLYGMATSRNLVHQVMCLSVVQSATYVLLLASGYREGGLAPIMIGARPDNATFVDPVVQALALTDIVVGAAVTALLLAIIIRVWRVKHVLDPDALTRDES
ncbi:MAG TPA: sodium:proton antiporter [Acetobacteraceae bacterium]|nr:sodium:proton antiporter [Acetobacteraceae bacterium]